MSDGQKAAGGGDMWSGDRRDLHTSMETLFPDPGPRTCRVCGRGYDDGRRSYCTDRCKRIARAVQKMYNWESVRDRIIERDNHTCQECGVSKELAQRAMWQIRERIDERNPFDVQEENDQHYARYRELRDKYNCPAWEVGMFHVDHIEPISAGGHPFEESNLQTLCQACHEEKTARENSRAGKRPELGLDAYLEEVTSDGE